MTVSTKQQLFQLISRMTPEQAYGWQCSTRSTVVPALFQQMLTRPVYARVVAQWKMKRRWPEAEPVILKDAYEIVEYAEHVIKGRWPEGEYAIMKYPVQAISYALYVLKDRWPEAEPTIRRRADTWHYYCMRFHIEEPVVEPEVVCP